MSRRTPRFPAAFLLAAGWLLFITGPPAAAADSPTWLTGQELERQLLLPGGVAWTENPLRRALANLAENQQTALWLDRRVDPETRVSATLRDLPLRDLYPQLGTACGLGVSRIGPVHYFGPPETARVLATAAAKAEEEIRRLPPAARGKLLRLQPTAWEELATPRAILEQMAAEAGLRIENPEAVPHDLWPQAALPPMNLADRLTLALAGFDLTFTFTSGGDGLRILPLPRDLRLTRALEFPSDPTLVGRLKERFPEVEMRREGRNLLAAGRVEDLETLEKLLRGERVTGTAGTASAAGSKVYTLKVENNTVGAVLKGVAQNMGWELEYRNVGNQITRPLNFDVKQVSFEELMKTILAPTSLKYELRNNQLLISPKND